MREDEAYMLSEEQYRNEMREKALKMRLWGCSSENWHKDGHWNHLLICAMLDDGVANDNVFGVVK